MTSADLVIYGTMIFCGLFVLVMSIWAIGNAKRTEATGKTLTAAWVRENAPEHLGNGQGFVWAVWEKRLSVGQMDIVVRSDTDQPITRIEKYAIVRDGLLGAFELNGTRYEFITETLLSDRFCLREAGQTTILVSCSHHIFSHRFYHGKEDTEQFRKSMFSAIRNHAKITRGQEEIGRSFNVIKGNAFVRVVSNPTGQLTPQELCFLLFN
jgi:hypothetical protein